MHFDWLSISLRLISESFYMSYIYNGSKIQIAQPVHSVSVNNCSVIFADKSGLKTTQFETPSDAREFIKWLTTS